MAFLPARADAQRTFGVTWDLPENRTEALAQLDHFDRLNIQYLEIDETVSDTMWKAIRDRNFNIYVQIPVRFPVVETFSNPDSELIATYQRYIANVAGRDIDGLGVFEFGQTNSRSFPDVAHFILGPINDALSVPLYHKDWNYKYQPVDTLFDFKVVGVRVDRNFESVPESNFTGIRALLYQPTPALSGSVHALKSFIVRTSANEDAVLFLDSTWLVNFMKDHPEVESIIRQYATQAEAVFPTGSEPETPDSRHSGIVLILLILWGTFALNYRFEPTYRRSLLRYFLSHKFFVEDVIARHIRSVLPSLVILLQHAVLGGIFLYSFTAYYFSPIGAEVFFGHYPELRMFGTGISSFFLMGTVATLLFELICLSWLYVANYKYNYLSQTLILYSWSLQLNLLVGTSIVTLLMAGAGSFFMILLFLLFLAVMIAAYPIASFDTGQHLDKYKLWYLIGTSVIYLFGLGGLLLWIFSNSYLLNVMRLAMSIP